MPKLGTENALFGYFSSRSSKRYCLFLKSAPSTLPNCKISRKKKMPKFGTKNATSGSFWAGI